MSSKDSDGELRELFLAGGKKDPASQRWLSSRYDELGEEAMWTFLAFVYKSQKLTIENQGGEYKPDNLWFMALAKAEAEREVSDVL